MNQENFNNEANNVVEPETTQELKNNTPKKNKKKLIIIISCVCLLAAAAAVYFLVFNKNKEEAVKENNNKQVENVDKVSIQSSDIKKAIENNALYYHSLYKCIVNGCKNINTNQKLYFSSLIKGDIYNNFNIIFNNSLTKDEILADDTLRGAILIDTKNGSIEFEMSFDEWHRLYHYIYDTKELDNKLEIYEYVLLEHGGTPDNENHYKYYKLGFNPYERFHSVEPVIELDFPGKPDFDITKYKDKASKVKWVFKKDSNENYIFESIELINDNVASDNNSNSSLENGQPVIDEILTALKSSDVKVEKIYCSNCKDIKNEFDRNQLSCDTQKVLDTAAVEKLYNKVLTISKPHAYGTGWICEVYKLKITSNGKTYVLSMINDGEILIGNENGVLYNAITDYDNHEILEKEYAEFFETL